MPTIPTLPGTEVRAAPIGAAPRSLQGEQAAARGESALAQGIAEVGGTINRFVLLSAQVKNEADLTAAKLQMEQTAADIQRDLESNPNPQTWEDLKEKRLQEAMGAIFTSQRGAAMAPVVRRQLEAEFRSYAVNTSEQVRTLAMRKQNDENDKVFQQAQAREVAAGNYDGEGGALHYIDLRERLGLISSAKATLERNAAAYDVDVQAVNRDIEDDPFIALEKLEDRTDGGKPRYFRNLSEKDRLSAIRSAKNAMETARAETAQQLQEDILENGGVGAEAKIDSWQKAGRLLPSQAINLKKFAAGQRGPQDMAAAGAQLWQAAMDLDPADPDYVQKAMRIRADVHALSPAVRDPIVDTLNQKDRNEVKEDTQKVYDMLNRDFRANTFGNVQTWTQGEIDRLSSKEKRRAGNPVEGDPKDRQAYEQANATLFRYQRAMRDFLQANPKATPEQIFEERSRLTGTDRQAALGGLVIDALSGSVQ